jgi:hypothetical protein
MKASLRIATLALSTAGLAACASSGMEKSTYVPPQRPPGTMVTDDDYVAYVERVARHRGVNVTWVNLPTKRVPDKH